MEALQPTNSLNILKLPYPIALVLAGLTISAFNLMPQIKMTPESRKPFQRRNCSSLLSDNFGNDSITGSAISMDGIVDV